MWPKNLKKYHSILELRDYSKKVKVDFKRNELRAKVKIAVIDDDSFKPRSNLENYGFQFDELQDIKSIEKVMPYDIVICDLMDVGVNFDAAAGGASIIGEIKRNFPAKFVIAYTGARANSPEANSAKEFADLYLRKDIEISKLVSELDDAIDYSLDPYDKWIITRQGLIDLDIDIREIVKLEDAYVVSVKEKDASLSKFQAAVRTAGISGHAKAIAQGLTASVIYGILFPA
jgi:CheY-like chemotaxis protein